MRKPHPAPLFNGDFDVAPHFGSYLCSLGNFFRSQVCLCYLLEFVCWKEKKEACREQLLMHFFWDPVEGKELKNI